MYVFRVSVVKFWVGRVASTSVYLNIDCDIELYIVTVALHDIFNAKVFYNCTYYDYAKKKPFSCL